MHVSNAEIHKILECHLQKVYKVRETSGPDRSGRGPDELILSKKAEEMLQIKRQIASLPETRGRLVQNIKQIISSGSYSVDDQQVADKMIESAILDRKT